MDNLTETFHVQGMLDRDIRTAKLCVLRDRQNSNSSLISSSYGCGCRNSPSSTTFAVLHNIPESTKHRTRIVSHTETIRGRTIPSSFSIRKNEDRKFRVSITRLHRTLILGFYLSILTSSTVLAAPHTKRSIAMTSNGIEKWKTPCGTVNQGPPGQVGFTDGSKLNLIIEQSKISQRKAVEFSQRYAERTFRMDWDQFHNLQKSNRYHWLPGPDMIPKSLGEPVKKTHLSSLKLDNALYNTYESLQRIAVGFDQIVMDSKSFKKDFEEMEKYALSVLCEIQTVMVERNLPKRPDVERNIMPESLRKLDDNTAMNARNYIVLRDYINILEYIIACFEHFK